MGRRRAPAGPNLRAAALLFAALAAGCAGSGEPPRPSADLPDAMPQDSPLSLDDPAPPALVPEAAAISDEADGGVPVGAEEAAAGAAPAPETAAVASSPAARSGATAIALAPLVGLPDGAAQSLARAMAARAPAHGLRIAPPEASSGALVVKGYLARMPGDSGDTILHVWDIYDASGRRLHRIEGSHAAVSGSADWDGVPSSAWDAVADKAWSALAAWLNGRAA